MPDHRQSRHTTASGHTCQRGERGHCDSRRLHRQRKILRETLWSIGGHQSSYEGEEAVKSYLDNPWWREQLFVQIQRAV